MVFQAPCVQERLFRKLRKSISKARTGEHGYRSRHHGPRTGGFEAPGEPTSRENRRENGGSSCCAKTALRCCCGQQQLSSCWSDLIGGPGLVPIAVRCSQDFGPPPSNVAPRQSAPCSPSSSKKLPEETVATHVANADALWQLFATTRTFQHIFSNRNTQRFGGPSLRSRGGL